MIPFVDLGSQHGPLMDELRAAFERVTGASGFILGEEVEGFEREFAAYCGVAHCVGVASGTAALTLAVEAAGIGEGDEVVVPAHTFAASALGVLHAGAVPHLCDVDPGTGLIDLDSAEAAITERTAAILPVHLYGQVCEMDGVRSLAARRGLAVIEDAAQAHGAAFEGRRAGSLGTAAAFSFYPSKNLGALGDGGAICTDDRDLAERARMLRHLGQRGKGEHVLTGYNERLDGLQAAFLRVKLPHLEDWNAARRRAAEAYGSVLEGKVRTLEERPATPCVYHLYPVRLPDRDAAAARLAEEGVQTGIHYSPALHEQSPFADLPRVDCAEAAAWAAEELSLPMFETLDPRLARSAGELCSRVAAELVTGG